MPVPLLDLSEQHAALGPELRRMFDDVVTSGRFILGPAVEAFERHLADYCGAAHAVGLSSGTDALLAAMMALDIGPGDEVITTPFTFFATVGGIVRLGATPVFVDIDPDTFNIDPAQIESAITEHTRAIVPVHLYGQAADMTAVSVTAHYHGVKVIEDAAQAIGAREAGPQQRRAGSIGDVGCLSFYPTKNLAAMGDAGACLTSDDGLAQRLGALRNHGQSGEYEHAWVGGNFRLDALQAAVLDLKLPQLDAWNQARRRLAQRYIRELAPLEAGGALGLPTEAAGTQHVYNCFTVRVMHGRRDALVRHLADQGIGHRVYYPLPQHLQPCFAALGCRRGDFPQAERAADEVVSLPIYPGLTEAQQDQVVRAVCECLSGE